MTNPATIVEQMLITHPSFVRAQEQLEQCFLFSTAKSEAEGLAIIGESGTGKTSVLSTFKDEHLPSRGADGNESSGSVCHCPCGSDCKEPCWSNDPWLRRT
jgi:ABC-type phosphonate transport system ATPase subunit